MKEYRSTKAKKIEFSSLVLVGPHWIIFVPLDCTKNKEHNGSKFDERTASDQTWKNF